RDDEGRRAHDDRRRAARLARAGREGARAAPARAVGQHRARDLRGLPPAAAGAAGGVPGVTDREASVKATSHGADEVRCRDTSPLRVDLACAEPAFLDLTFVGLDGVPRLGEERLANDLLRSPGGGAIPVVGAARLGLSTALVSPVG